LQLERGEVAFYIYTNGSMSKANLTLRFQLTDEALNNMTLWTDIRVANAFPNGTEDDDEVMLNKTSFHLRLKEFRNQIDAEENTVFGVSFGRCC